MTTIPSRSNRTLAPGACSICLAAPAPVYRSPSPTYHYSPPPPARQSLSGLGALSSGAGSLSKHHAKHRNG